LNIWFVNLSEEFGKVIKTIELPEGIARKDCARPRVDPPEKPGLLK
jgi:hypothetical protein